MAWRKKKKDIPFRTSCRTSILFSRVNSNQSSTGFFMTTAFGGFLK